MKNDTELEMKFAVPDSRLFDVILKDPHILSLSQGILPRMQKFEALYYDTPTYALQKAGIAYRVRKEDEEWIATFKSDRSSSGGLYSREEVNEKIAEIPIRHSLFVGTFAGERMASVIDKEPLELLFTMNFNRQSILLQTEEGLLAEMALDRGTIWSGITGLPICELELELKQGKASQLLELALWISRQWHLLPEPRSKYARGLDLLQSGISQSSIGDNQVKVKLRPELLSLSGKIINTLSQSQLSLIEDGAGPETVRQLRIQCRRLRSLLKFFEPTSNTEVQNHIVRLRQWGAWMGKIRDIDILEQARTEFVQRFSAILSLNPVWNQPLIERRNFLATELLFRLQRAELAQILLEIQASIYRDLEESNDELVSPGRKESFIRKNMALQIKKMKEETENVIAFSSMKKLHRLRIRAKNLRYILEFMNDSTLGGFPATIIALKKLQSTIGKLHDGWQIKNLLEQIEAGDNVDRFRMEQELFLAWRFRTNQEYMFALRKNLNQIPKDLKKELRTLSTLRGGRRNKPPHNADTHEPTQ